MPGKPTFEPHLARLEDPSATVASIASSVGWQDYEGLLFLGNYLKKSVPNSPSTYSVLGLAKYMDGEYQMAADYYRLAFQSEKDPDALSGYVNAYVEAMSAVGQGVAAWKAVPDQKSAFESLAYSYEEQESLLSDQEFREIVKLYRGRFPEALDGFHYLSNIAIEERRYQDATRILQAGLVRAEAHADDEESEYDRDLLRNSLVSVLYKLGRTKEAYEVADDRKQNFALLCRLASSDRHWDDVRGLLKMHRAREPNDPQLNYFTGELAAHEKLWEEAIRELENGMKKLSEDERWMFERRLQEIYIESDRWLGYYTASREQKEVFVSLADRFVLNENWESLNTLIAEHQRRWPRDIWITKYQADVSWQLKDYPAYVRQVEALLECKDEEVLPLYNRRLLENRLLSALLRSKTVRQAHELARKQQQKDNDSASLAIVSAASGNYAEAERLARRAAAGNDSAAQFYSDDDVGPIFLSSHFRQLQNGYPVELFYGIARTSVVFLSQEPWQMQADTIATALKDFGVEGSVSVRPLKSTRQDVVSSFAVRLENASIWVASGTGKFDLDWKFADVTAPLSAKANECQYWLAVGYAAWTGPRREQVEDLVRYLAFQLSKGKADVFCAKEKQPWEATRVYPARDELLSVWLSSGNMKSLRDQSLPLEVSYQNRNLVADRQFERELREAVRTFESSPDGRLKVLTCLSQESGVDPIWLLVSSVKRKYGGLRFDGILISASELIPELRKGLRVCLDYNDIRAWRLNSERPVIRAQ